MNARLTKPATRCKAHLICAAVALASPAAANPAVEAADLRDCIAQARDAGAVAACERTEQAVLQARIERWSTAIRGRLDAQQRLIFELSEKAWQAFVDSETAMLDVTLALRKDGLAARLRPGAVTRLYEERERQLREHLHNLSYGMPTGAATPR